MAAEKKSEQNLTVEQRLKSLYDLQTILSEIDRIKTIRGELPLEVKDLEDQIAGLHTRIDNFSREIAEFGQAVEAEKRKIADCEALIERYSKQMDNVRNSREYDLLHKEVEFQTLEIELANKHINDHSRAIEARHNDIAATQERLADLEHILGEKQSELNEIVSETRQEEEQRRQQNQEKSH